MVKSENQSNNFDTVDLARVFCAFSVAMVHCQPMVHTMKPVIVSLTGFRTYFFVLVFFYFLSRDVSKISPKFLRARISQLITPYLFWTAIYFALRLISMQDIQRKYYISNIESVIFFGNSGVQMYFIPMIITGLIIFSPISMLYQKFNKNTYSIALSIAISLIFRPGVIISSFENTLFANNTSSIQLLYWSIWLIPFILISILINTSTINKIISEKRNYITLTTSLILITTLIPIRNEVSDHIAILQATSMLLLSISIRLNFLSPFLRSKIRILSSVIFYSHPLYIESYQYIKRIYFHSITFNIIDILLTIFLIFTASILFIPQIEKKVRLKRLLIGR